MVCPKIVQARVWAQGSALGLLLGVGVFAHQARKRNDAATIVSVESFMIPGSIGSIVNERYRYSRIMKQSMVSHGGMPLKERSMRSTLHTELEQRAACGYHSGYFTRDYHIPSLLHLNWY